MTGQRAFIFAELTTMTQGSRRAITTCMWAACSHPTSDSAACIDIAILAAHGALAHPC